MRRPWSLVLLLAAGVPRSSLAETPALQASASKTEVSVGEAFVVEVKALGPTGTIWTFPVDASSEDVELKRVDSGTASGPQRYQATVFALRDVVVPSLTAKYRLADGTQGEASTEAIPLRVVSLLPKDPREQKLADIRPPVGLSTGRIFWIALALVVLLVAAVATLLRRRRVAEAVGEGTPETPPDLEARAALRRLEESSLLDRGELKQFYVELTEIAKRYLERRLRAPVLEMTSAETLATLRDHAHALVVLAPMRSLMGTADPVKFAQGGGHPREARNHLEAVREMIASLETRLLPPVDQKVA